MAKELICEAECPMCGEMVKIYKIGYTPCPCGEMIAECTVNWNLVEEDDD